MVIATVQARLGPAHPGRPPKVLVTADLADGSG